MNFEVLEFRKIGPSYDWKIKGSKPWKLEDIMPYFAKVSQENTDYSVTKDFEIVDNGDSEKKKARLTLENTVTPEINMIHVDDSGIGPAIVSKYLCSVMQKLE
jgi:hypothetical protein